jgi:RES domain
MSSIIWTPDELLSNSRPLSGDCWRVVESQSKGSTLKLTDTLPEQLVLENLIETTKPPIPEQCAEMHYLLFTPFRYSPYPHNSRFRRSGFTSGVFYGAESSETAVAEKAFYRLLFFSESPDTPWPANPIDYRAFAAEFNTGLAIDLTALPLNLHRAHWTNPTDYTACLELADAARSAGIEAIRYESVRDPLSRTNLALLSPAVLIPAQRFAEETWLFHFSKSGVRAICESPPKSLAFDSGTFSADPRTASWRWDR